MNSGFVESLKLALSDKFNLSDGSYSELSDILLKSELSDEVFDTGLIQLLSMLIRYDKNLPVNLEELNDLWSSEYLTINFSKTLIPLVKLGIIKLRKVNNNGTQTVSVTSTEKWDDLYNRFRDILSGNMLMIEEGYLSNISVDNKLSEVLNKCAKNLNELHCKLELESISSDDVLHKERMNLIVSQTSEYSCKDSDILRLAKKYISKVNTVTSVEAYIEDRDTLFVGIEFDNSKINLSELPTALYKFVEDLEVNYV